MTSPIDLDAIEAKAKAATPGPWATFGHHGVDPGKGSLAFSVFTGDNAASDAAHIAGLDPQTVLAIVAEVRALREQVDALATKGHDLIVALCMDEAWNAATGDAVTSLAALVVPILRTAGTVAPSLTCPIVGCYCAATDPAEPSLTQTEGETK